MVAGAGVFTFEDGSLLVVTVADGSACIDLAAGHAAITVNYEISGGTGHFREASGKLTMSGTLMVVLRDASNAPVLLTNTGRIKGHDFRREALGMNKTRSGRPTNPPYAARPGTAPRSRYG